MACPHQPNCPLYPTFRSQALLRIWQINFCEGEHEKCARFQLSEQGKPVPINLLPNGQTLNLPTPRP